MIFRHHVQKKMWPRKIHHVIQWLHSFGSNTSTCMYLRTDRDFYTTCAKSMPQDMKSTNLVLPYLPTSFPSNTRPQVPNSLLGIVVQYRHGKFF